MKRLLLFIITIIAIFWTPTISYGQIVLGPAASKFVLYTSSGAVSDNASAHSHLTGDVGTSTVGPITGFGNVDGVMHPGADVATAACNVALLATITQLNAVPATLFPSGTMGSGTIFTPGVYSIPGNATLTLDLILDGQNNPNAEFIIKIGGTFGTNTNSKVRLINGALACHVYWQITGAVTMASLSTMRGNIISGGAINMGSGDSLEGRAFSTVGLIAVDGITAFMPIGCNSPVLTGPKLPDLASIACYTIFSSNGALANTAGTSAITGDVGKNNNGSSITGWTPADVNGTLHSVQDPSTILAAADLSKLYDSLNALVPDIELLYPAQFGRDLKLTPHVYVMNGATTFTDSLYLDAQGNPDGVFVIKVIGGALTTSTYSKVKLINGAQSRNVFWMVQGAVSINNYSVFRGTIVIPVGALNFVNLGIVLDGRALTMSGAITTEGLTAANPPSSFIATEPVSQIGCAGSSVMFTIKAVGSGLTYRWRKGNVNLTNSGNISGADNDTLIINPAGISDTASNYNVIISGGCSPNDTSNNVSLNITAPPIITIEPANQVSCSGGAVMFTVKATGSGLTYRWRRGSVDLIDNITTSGVTSDTLRLSTVTALDTASNYNVIVSGTCLPADTSIDVSLSLNGALVITTEPANQVSCSGAAVMFTVKATGSGLTYRWRRGAIDLLNIGNISGAFSDTLRINSVGVTDTASDYNVIVSGACSPNDTSLNASLIMNAAPVITLEPINQISCPGSAVMFTVNATGSGLTYRWRKGTVNLNNAGNISGADDDTLRINPTGITDTASNYNVIVSGACSPNDTSVNASLTINAAPVITLEPINQVSCSGNAVMFVVKATGSGLTYRWRKGTVDLNNAGNISGVLTDTLRINPSSIADTASNYNVIVTGACALNDTSLNASLMMNVSPVITVEPINQVACSGGAVMFTAKANGPGLTYRWRRGAIDLLNIGNTSGVLTDTLRINPAGFADTASNYNVIVSGTCSVNDTSLNASLILNTAPIITLEPVNQISCEGGAVMFTVKATGTGLTYRWRKGSVNLNNTGNISGVLTDTLRINPAGIADTSSNYNVIVSGTCLPNDTSISASLIIMLTPVAVAGSNSPVCSGNAINLTAQTVTGATYQWTGPNGYTSPVQNPVIPVATNLHSGVYSLTVFVVSCSSAPSTVTVVVNNCDSADLSIVKTVNNTHPVIGSSVVFTILAENKGPKAATAITITDVLPSGYTYVSSSSTKGTYNPTTGIWTIDTLQNNATATLTMNAVVNASGVYVNTATIDGFEFDKDTLNNISSVETFPSDFFIPQGFSPNGDGTNDLFVIRGIDQYPANTFTIFNRWGNKVFDGNPYKSEWDGKSTEGMSIGGEVLPVGTYFYVLDLGDGSDIIKGTIYLNK